jgi:hypothetical protein
MNTDKICKMMLVQICFLCLCFAQSFGAMELPSKLSKVPVYSGSKIIQIMDMGTNSMAALEVKADHDALMKFYKKEMQEKGWKTAFQVEQEDNAVIHFTKDNQTIQISANKGEEGVTLYQMVFVGQ